MLTNCYNVTIESIANIYYYYVCVCVFAFMRVMKSIDSIIYGFFFRSFVRCNDKKDIILNTDQGHFPSKLNLHSTIMTE